MLYRVALQMLKIKKKSIKHLKKVEDVVDELKTYHEFTEANVDDFFREMFELKLRREDIVFYCNEYAKKHKAQ